MVSICFIVSSAVQAQDVASGPVKGEAVPALKVFDGTGDHAGKEVDYAAEREKKPTVYLLVNADKWDRPVARFVRTLDETLAKEGGEARAVAVWVGSDAEKMKQYLPVAQNALKLQRSVLTAFTGGPAGPDAWGANADAHLTAVVAADGKVAAVFGYRSTNETDVPAVVEALNKAMGK
jgi:hypothetical protein